MCQKQTHESGFAHLFLIIIVLAVVAGVGFAGFNVYKSKDKSSQSSQPTSSESKNSDPVKWAFNEKELQWFTQSGKPTKCKNPFIFDQTPVDIAQVTSLLMPGSYRGYNYKPHGGFRIDNSPDGKVEVKMPIDATLVSLTRYYEGNPSTLQYLLTFETDCGIAFRFDHLYTLAPAFQKIADTTPEPKKDDTRTDPNLPFARTKFKSGDVVATAIGFPATKNFGFDFGVYDYRSRNEISKNSKWAGIHNQYQSHEWFASCWFGMFPSNDANKIKALGKVVVNPSKPNIISDLCSEAPYNTLDFNNGQPTDS
ncbi:hypothetical protein A3F37_00510 [Candidatus Saccharibacteria bacterium RIFCSPHIGHO2_12_FULL_41_12]|nr:MAG: hypothetical protein A3F37_00510 [Candidatus Saccharibacteria bacterium RIFCSPHIGHO2_12_FULL_41_12]